VSKREEKRGFPLETVEITSEKGAAALGKPVGRYVTLELTRLLRREDEAFSVCAEVLAEEIGKLLQLDAHESVLVAGLGNDGITADSVGPLAVRSTLVTRHLDREQAELLGLRRSVSAVETGVSGTSPGSRAQNYTGRGPADPSGSDRGGGRAGFPLRSAHLPHGAAFGRRHCTGLRGGQRPCGHRPEDHGSARAGRGRAHGCGRVVACRGAVRASRRG
jgi:hypothetical protein